MAILMRMAACGALLVAQACALAHPQPAARAAMTRRQLAGSALLAPATALWTAAGAGTRPPAARAADELATLPVYFGCGCFWHVQHEFVELERSLLKRSNLELSSRCGYAGGTRSSADGKVCYHNMRGVGDYGKQGHAEAVAMRLPPSALPEFAKLYFSLFVSYNILPGRSVFERADPQDGGPEYRSVLGIPGGVNSPYYPQIVQACAGKMKLVEVRAEPVARARRVRSRPGEAARRPHPLNARGRPPSPRAPLPHRARATSRTRCSSAPST